MSEKVIKESGIDYTLVKPSGISDEPSCVGQTFPPIGQQPTPRHLLAVPGDLVNSNPIPVPSKISKYDVADLCVEAAIKSGGFLSKSSVICCSQLGRFRNLPRNSSCNGDGDVASRSRPRSVN